MDRLSGECAVPVTINGSEVLRSGDCRTLKFNRNTLYHSGAATHSRRRAQKQTGEPVRQTPQRLAERTRLLLAGAGITLHRASVESERLYGGSSPFRIPHTLYHSLDAAPGFRPSLHEVAALSRISGYRFEDWLLALGLDLRRLAAASSFLSARRTRIIDPSFATFEYFLPGLCTCESHQAAVLPFSEMLDRYGVVRRRFQPDGPPGSTFARLGTEDAFAYPELLPGSVIRVNPLARNEQEATRGRPQLLLIEHGQGYWCGRFDVSKAGAVRIAASEMAYAPALLAIPAEARIIGAVDMEIRWPQRYESPLVPQEFSTWRQPQAIGIPRSLRELLRQARSNAGWTLADASGLSRRIAGFLHDEQYAISPSTLADFENRETPPRHLQQVLAVCVAYGIAIRDFLAAAGIAQDSLGHTAVPAPLVNEWGQHRFAHTTETADAQILNTDRDNRIPWFLRDCLSECSGISRPSVRDLFRLAGDHPFLPKSMAGGCVALVNRRMKKPVRAPDLPGWRQPAYVLWRRSGEYLCACCSAEENTLVLYPESGTGAPERVRRDDAEIIGQIVGLARYIR